MNRRDISSWIGRGGRSGNGDINEPLKAKVYDSVKHSNNSIIVVMPRVQNQISPYRRSVRSSENHVVDLTFRFWGSDIKSNSKQ